MSKPQKRGKLRNPPRGRQYALTAVVIVILIVLGSVAYLYTSHAYNVFPAASTTSLSRSTSSLSTTTPTYALISTNLGLIEVQLYPNDAPKTVANFVNLTQSGFYNGLIWHRIVPGFVIQSGDSNTRNGGGDKATWGSGTSGVNVPFENDGNLHNTAGTIAMASTAAKSGGSSQFYINLVDNSASLDGNYAVFGKVIKGMDVVQALGQVPTNASQQPTDPTQATIVSITIQNTP